MGRSSYKTMAKFNKGVETLLKDALKMRNFEEEEEAFSFVNAAK